MKVLYQFVALSSEKIENIHTFLKLVWRLILFYLKKFSWVFHPTPQKKSKLVYIPLKNYKVKSLIPSTIQYFLVLFVVLLREAALVTWQACGRT